MSIVEDYADIARRMNPATPEPCTKPVPVPATGHADSRWTP